jgi:hypothetical protein
MSPYFGWVPRCAICRNSVNLRVSKTDEYGRAVHEYCYVLKLLSKNDSSLPLPISPMPTEYMDCPCSRQYLLAVAHTAGN